jgi:hypothetical protein
VDQVDAVSRDDALRAAVYTAHEARGTEEFPGAVLRIVDAWTLWPLIELDRDIHGARRAVMLAEATEAARVWDDSSEIAAQLWGQA